MLSRGVPNGPEACIPSSRHDKAELDKAVASVKASFKHLDCAEVRLDRQAARTKERLLTQILGMHHKKVQKHSDRKPAIPKAVDAATALGGKDVEPSMGRGPVSRGFSGSQATTDVNDDSDDSEGASSYGEDEVQAFTSLGFGEIAERHRRVQRVVSRRSTLSRLMILARMGGSFPMEESSPSSPWKSSNSDGEDSNDSAAPSLGAVLRAQKSSGKGRRSGVASQHSMRKSTALGAVAAAAAGMRPATPRVVLHVVANRPFSAPRATRWDAAEPPSVQRPLPRRPASAAIGGGIRCQFEGGAVASSKAVEPSPPASARPSRKGRRSELAQKLRPASAFTDARRPLQQMRLREVVAPKSQQAAIAGGMQWEQQARWMSLGG